MAVSKGKNFERQFKISAEKDELFILRLNDSSLSWQHEKTARFTSENPCDYLLFYKGHLFPFELKSTEYSSMSIQRTKEEKSKMIKMHQWNSLSHFNLFEGVEPGLILNFRDKESTDELTYFVAIQDFINFLADSDKGSINQKDILAMPNTIIISQKLKRTNYIYSVKELLEEILMRKEE